jgi:hypothetical protein
MQTLDQYPQRDGLYRVLPEGVAVQNRYQDRVVMLDALSSEIWLRADGKTTLRDIAHDIAGMGDVPINTMCRIAAMLIVMLNSEGVLYSKNDAAALPYHLQLPQEDQDLDKMHSSMVAAGWLNE